MWTLLLIFHYFEFEQMATCSCKGGQETKSTENYYFYYYGKRENGYWEMNRNSCQKDLPGAL